jgi:hypothetical protein
MRDLTIQYLDVEALIPYARNARTHSDAQVAQIAASIREFGWTNPILVDDKQGIIAGHGRVLAARKLGVVQVPTIELGGLSEAQRRAYIIADNKLAENVGWDSELLALELGDLKLQDFDLELTGFDDLELGELLGDTLDVVETEKPTITPEIEAMLTTVWAGITTDWAAHIAQAKTAGLLSTRITPNTAAWHFVQAKHLGGEYPGFVSLAFTPQRFWTGGAGKCSVAETIAKAATHGPSMNGVRWALDDKPEFDRLLSFGMPMAGSRLPLDFPSWLSRSLIDEFCPAGGRVLDPCHGWGGRYVGFLLSDKPSEYTGYDPSPDAHAGLEKTRETLSPYAEDGKIADFIQLPFEDGQLSGLCDFALTSPPYFDVEVYAGENTSHRRYKGFDAWVQGFYLPMLRKVAAHLNDGAVFALQVGSQSYPLAQTAIDNAAACGLTFVEKRNAGMNNSLAQTSDDTAEAVIILKRETSPAKR